MELNVEKYINNEIRIPEKNKLIPLFEAISNSILANAKNIVINIEYKDEPKINNDFHSNIIENIIISDDGIGFNVQETLINTKQKGNRYGLIGIFERVKQLRGKIEVKSSKGEGTIYKIRLPINRKVIRND